MHTPRQELRGNLAEILVAPDEICFARDFDERTRASVGEDLSANDAFVMFTWAKDLKLDKVFMLPDGNGDFTEKMGMLVKKTNLGFGDRSWRYSMFVDDGVIKQLFVEPGFMDDCPTDPFEVSDAQTMLNYLKEQNA